MIDILYIEDNADDADIFSRLIKKLDQPVEYKIINNGSEAIEYLSGQGDYQNQPLPRLLLLDVNLTGMSGFDVLQRIREVSRARWLPIIAFSTSDSPSDIRQAYAIGVNAYIVKPGSYQATEHLLRRLCQFWLTDNVRTDYR